jgi:hypothetical protein
VEQGAGALSRAAARASRHEARAVEHRGSRPRRRGRSSARRGPARTSASAALVHRRGVGAAIEQAVGVRELHVEAQAVDVPKRAGRRLLALTWLQPSWRSASSSTSRISSGRMPARNQGPSGGSCARARPGTRARSAHLRDHHELVQRQAVDGPQLDARSGACAPSPCWCRTAGRTRARLRRPSPGGRRWRSRRAGRAGRRAAASAGADHFGVSSSAR